MTQAQRALSWLRLQAARLLPGSLAALALALPSYRYRFLWGYEGEGLYVESRALFLFGSDLLIVLAVAAWLASPWARRVSQRPAWLILPLVLLAAQATVSAAWASLPIVTLSQAARLWLLWGLFLAAATAWEARGVLAWGLLISGASQALIGLAQFILQHSLGWRDLGELVIRPEWPGAAIVAAGGERILRAYGLTQHPNILGGFLAATVLLGAGLVLGRRGAAHWLAVGLTALSFGGLLLTFSRAAWLGLAAGGVVMVVLRALFPFRADVHAACDATADENVAPASGLSSAHRPQPGGLQYRPLFRAEGQQAKPLLLAFLLVALLFVATQWRLLLPRLGAVQAGQEIRSTDERATLTAGAWVLIRERPWLGVGYGNFAAALWLRQPPEMAAYPIYQPVHSAPLLAAAELGLPGALLWLALAAGPWLMLWARRRGGAARPLAPLTIAAAGAVAALTAISLFDFYPWFSQQGRTLLWILWGLFAQGMIHVDVTRAA